jgi:hypothetical protein
MTSQQIYVTLLVVLCYLSEQAFGQASIDSHAGYDVPKNCGIAIGIYYGTLIGIFLTINGMKKFIIDRYRKRHE